MMYFLLAVMFLLCTVNAPQPVSAAATLSVTITPPLIPGETYANAWAAAGPTPATVAQPCGTYGKGVRNSAGSMVECPTGAATGALRSATHPNGDRATASAWAQISGGIGTASAPVNIPSKPQVFAGAAAYAKANSSVPKDARGAKKVGGNFTITYGNLTLNGWGEPADVRTVVLVDDLGPDQVPNELANVLDEDSIKFLKDQGLTFAQSTIEYFRIGMVLQGKQDAKVKVGKPIYFKGNLPKCPNGFKVKLKNAKASDELEQPACLFSEQSPSEKDFTPCQDCRHDELKHSLDRTFEVELYIPGEDLSENVSVHEISCVKSRDRYEPPPKDGDICSLLLHLPQGKNQPY